MKTTIDLRLLENLLESIYEVTPKLIGGIVLIIVGWLALKMILFVIKKSLKLTRIDDLAKKFYENNPILLSTIKLEPTKVILFFAKWFLILVFVIIGADMLGLTMISNEIGKLIAYLPKFFSAILIFVLGIYGAGLLRNALASLIKAFDLNGSKAISQIVFYILFVIVAIMSLSQAGIDTSVITNNMFLIMGAFLLAFTLALGLGSRDVILRLLLGFYSRKNFQIGQRIKIDNVEGEIIAIDNICLVLMSNNQKTVYPIKQVASKKVEILEG
ncbi:Mechanosensitive ion channel [Zhouia amylolytica]|uniref:Mechanosensitive ion channel n=1 Tax=Zhouia amylolytica TaxID=376730 RepID=A0A1I6V4U6_9FLAO|nr:mechanosensitive ion channel [Zhouia amylolytica]MCQ0110031.1 mechanosensitive ion channel [Zhouia amylolytica]SFT08691.1 Mechanosensitive ion channel [Zhouia amylolytica]